MGFRHADKGLQKNLLVTYNTKLNIIAVNSNILLDGFTLSGCARSLAKNSILKNNSVNAEFTLHVINAMSFIAMYILSAVLIFGDGVEQIEFSRNLFPRPQFSGKHS